MHVYPFDLEPLLVIGPVLIINIVQ